MSGVNGIELQLPGELKSLVESTLADWDQGQKMQRLWNRDASLRRLREAIDQAV